MRVALATCSALPDLYPGDRPLVGALQRVGANATPWTWTEPRPDDIDAVVVRTVWDYWHHKAKFRIWLRELAAARIPTLNPVALMEWNLDKRYLLELEKSGARLPRTRCVEDGDSFVPAIADLGVSKVVVKPTISAGGDDTYAFTIEEMEQARPIVDGLLSQGPVLVQEFCEEVAQGELSLVFLGGVYSHTVRKRARPGEFRVHVEYGGSVEVWAPNEPLIKEATALVHGLSIRPCYARVDALVRGGQLLLIELELIEPELFFDYLDGSADAFARAIVDRVGNSAA